MEDEVGGGACSTHGEKRNVYKILVGKLKGRDHLQERGTDVRIILEWILRKQGGRVWTGCIWPRMETSEIS
jgi:hypothetical protein